jgi:hypothetical protein
MRTALLTALLALATGLVAFLGSSLELPDLEVRTIPWNTAAGGLRAAAPAGETFQCERNGLDRVDVAVTPLDPAKPENLELVLRADGPQGEVLRRAIGSELEPYQWGGWLQFRFEPVADSAGRRFHVSIGLAGDTEKTHVAPFARYRGHIGRGKWQGEIRRSGTIEAELLSEEPDLRALGFFLPRFSGPIELALLDAQSGVELRRGRFEPPAPTEYAWVIVSFDPIHESRWKRYRYRIELAPGDEQLADDKGPCYFPFHGSGAVDARLGGMTLGSLELADRDLIVRAWSDTGPGNAFDTLRARLGWRLLPMVLAWLAASALLGFALDRARR